MFGIRRSCCNHLSSQEKLSLKPAPWESTGQTCRVAALTVPRGVKRPGSSLKAPNFGGVHPFPPIVSQHQGGWITGGSVEDTGRK